MKKSEYLELSAHEEKNIIASISGYSEFISCGIVQGDQIEDTAIKIRGLAERLNDFTEKRCLYELLESNQYQQEITLLNMNDIIVENKEILQRKYAASIHLWYEGCEINQEIIGDKKLFQKLSYGLMENACRYGENCSTIQIMVKNVGSEILFSVSNETEGEFPEDLRKLQEPFYRVDKEKSRRVGGHGLGLSIAKEIMNVFHGALKLSYEAGRFAAEAYFSDFI